MYSDFYDGEIAINDNRKLESVSKIHDESGIRSSTTWDQKQKRTIVSEFTQYGGASIGFCFNIPITSMETVITSYLCNGSLITLEFHGDTHGFFSTKYYSHSHGNEILCSDTDCIKTEVENINDSLEPRCMPNFIVSLAQKQSLFLQQFVNNQNFEHYAEEYFSGIKYSLNGSGKIMGILWTKNCNKLNVNISKSSFDGSSLDVTDYLQYIEEGILTTVNKLQIQQLLNIPEDEAQKISVLARKYQIDLDMKDSYVPLPSYETMMCYMPGMDAIYNIQSAKRLLEIMKTLLLDLEFEQKNSLTTEEWLSELMLQAKFTLQNESSKLKIEFKQVELTFLLETRLTKLIDKYNPFIGMLAQQK